MPKRRKLPKSRKMPKRRKSTKNVGKKRIGGMKSARTRREYYIDSWGKPHDKVFDKCFAGLIALATKSDEMYNQKVKNENVHVVASYANNLIKGKTKIEEMYFQLKKDNYEFNRTSESKYVDRLTYKRHLCEIMTTVVRNILDDVLDNNTAIPPSEKEFINVIKTTMEMY